MGPVHLQQLGLPIPLPAWDMETLTCILSVIDYHLISDVKLSGVDVVFTVCMAASSILVESFSCCRTTIVKRQIVAAGRNAACASDPEQQGWGSCPPTLCTDRGPLEESSLPHPTP